MKKSKKYIGILLSLMMMIVLSSCQQDKPQSNETLKEDVPVVKKEEEPRIVALSVTLVDILAKLDIDMVGVPNSQYKLNDKAKGITQVGLSMSPDVEAIARLKPTHILSLTTLKSMVQDKLNTIGVEPTYLDIENIDKLKQTIETIGEMFDREKEAKQMIADFEKEIDATLLSVKGKKSPKVLVLFGFPGNYLVATNESFVGQMVEMVGGSNIVKEGKGAYMNVNLEALLKAQPDIILRMTHGVKEEVIEMFNKEFSENPIWKKFNAVEQGKVYDLDDSLFNVSASLDTTIALEELAKIIY